MVKITDISCAGLCEGVCLEGGAVGKWCLDGVAIGSSQVSDIRVHLGYTLGYLEKSKEPVEEESCATNTKECEEDNDFYITVNAEHFLEHRDSLENIERQAKKLAESASSNTVIIARGIKSVTFEPNFKVEKL